MSLQWTLVATFLYFEVGFIFVLLLPFISATRWQQIFKSRLVKALTSYASIYFNVILVALILLLLDAIREIVKYKTKLNTSNDPQHQSLHYGPTMELVKEFRAQRNFYISGTALFLWFVMKRILAFITQTAQLIADGVAAKKQAESATRTAELLLEAQNNQQLQSSSTESKTTSTETVAAATVDQSALLAKDDEIKQLEQSLKTAKLNLDTMVKQSESVSREYDNLLKEHAKLTLKLEKLEYGSSDSKKDH